MISRMVVFLICFDFFIRLYNKPNKPAEMTVDMIAKTGLEKVSLRVIYWLEELMIFI